MTKAEREGYEIEIDQILNKRLKENGLTFDQPINLKKFNQEELMYFFYLVKYNLKTKQ
jgi:hypothetical protein